MNDENRKGSVIVSRFVIQLRHSFDIRASSFVSFVAERFDISAHATVTQASCLFSSARHLCLAMSRRLGSLHDLSGWKPELLFVAERFDGVERGGFARWIKAEEDADGCTK